MPDFSWIPIYREIANKLLDYEHNQIELINILEKLRQQGLPIIPLNDKDEAGAGSLLNEIDPFTFYSSWNRGITNQNRKDILKGLKELWKLDSYVPDDFSGIPVMNNQRAWFFSGKTQRKQNDIPILWTLFREAVQSQISAASFNAALEIRNVKYNLTMGLYWINPEKYLNLDSVNRSYLKEQFELDIDELDFNTYENILSSVKAKSDKSFYEISYSAWRSKADKVVRYWVLNAYKEDLLGYCLKKNFWMMQYQYGKQDAKMVTGNWRSAIQVKEGDQILLYCYDNKYFAWGTACKPKIVPDQTDVAEDIIASKKAKYETGTTVFDDAECFYENLTDTPPDNDEPWGQRIDVDDWKGKKPEGVVVGGLSAAKKGNPRTAISEINETLFFAVKNALEGSQIVDPVAGSGKAMSMLKSALPNNIILYGAPGTGKTYETKRLAVELSVSGRCSQFPSDVKRAEILQSYNDLSNKNRIRLVTFHPSFSYEDFVEGIRPYDCESGVRYRLQDGIFKEICSDAAKNPLQHYVLVIDEINRGNVAQILGELITLIEPDKRDGMDEQLAVLLPYSKKQFKVPLNLHIIGTMNTADRSVEALDTALRRRFDFWEMKPKYDLLSSNVEGVDIVQLLSTINARLEVLKDRDHAIGHAYFINVRSLSELSNVFSSKVVPLLQEYFFNHYEKIGQILGGAFVTKTPSKTSFPENHDDDIDEMFIYRLSESTTWNAESFKSIYELTNG